MQLFKAFYQALLRVYLVDQKDEKKDKKVNTKVLTFFCF